MGTEENRPATPPTIYDVAAACGVAASTVSRTFSRPGRVNAETAARIRQVAEEMGYRTTPLPRPVPRTRTSLIAVLVSDLGNPFFFELLRGAQDAAVDADQTLLVSDMRESADSERRAIERIVPRVDGLILATSRISDSAVRVAAKQLPTVVLNRVVTDVPSMVTDNAGGMRLAVEHLAGLGHAEVWYVSGPESSWANGARWRALRDEAERLGVTTHATPPMSPTLAGGRRAAGAVADRHASAVIAYNDMMAIGLLQGLRRLGVQVPHHVSVVGFDDVFGADLVTPGLTTVAAPLRDLGGNAVRAVVRQLHAPSPRPAVVKPLTLPAMLKVRESTDRYRRTRWRSIGPPGPGA